MHASPQASQRSMEAVAQALAEHAGSFRAFVRKRVPSAEIDDVLQLAAMRAVERATSLEDPERVVAWLYRIHRNVIADVRRKRESRQRVLDSAALDRAASALPATSMTPAPSASACACSLAQAKGMNASYAEILELVDMGDLTIAEAAEVLGVSTNNATVRLHRARKALRRRMLEHCGVTSLRDCTSCRCVEDGCCAA